MDYDGVENKVDKETKLIRLCNPYNPVGRVWMEEEIGGLGDVCIKDDITIFKALGLEVAYDKGEEWLEEVLEYIEDNIDFAIDYINMNIPGIKVDRPDGTYLLWLDFRGIDRSVDEINEALIERWKTLWKRRRRILKIKCRMCKNNIERGIKENQKDG